MGKYKSIKDKQHSIELYLFQNSFWIVFFAAIVAISFYGIVFKDLPISENPGRWGSFGDFIGGLINPLTSILILRVSLKVWELQKDELKLTREELEESRKVMQEQAKTAEQQRSEQRFFDLFKIYKEVVNDFTIVTRDNKFTGKSAIGKSPYISSNDAYRKLPIKSYHYYDNIEIPSTTAEEARMILSTNEWNYFILDKKHYLRIIFSIFEELEKLLTDDHWHYGKIFRSQLSGGEVALLTLSLLFDEKGQTMRPLAAKYGLLKHLPANELRTYAEQELPPLCFGRKWAAAHPAMPSEETQPC